MNNEDTGGSEVEQSQMSVASSVFQGDPERVLLRWSEAPNLPSREEFVQILWAHDEEALIRSASKLVENTQVYLITERRTEDGIVQSCREEGSSFVLRIAIAANVTNNYGFELDPGVFAIEDLLTEEQEVKILEDLEKEDTARRAVSPKTSWFTAYTVRLKTVDLIPILYRLINGVPLASLTPNSVSLPSSGYFGALSPRRW